MGSSRNTGLTLIEMMLALAVAAVLASVALPSMRDLQQRHRIDASANEMVAFVNLARQHAVMHREITVMCPSLDGLGCSGDNRWENGWIVFRDPDGNRRADRPADVLRIGNRIDGLIIDSAGRRFLRYRPSGYATGTNLTIKLCPGEEIAYSRAIIVNNQGRPRVDDVPPHLSCPNTGP